MYANLEELNAIAETGSGVAAGLGIAVESDVFAELDAMSEMGLSGIVV